MSTWYTGTGKSVSHTTVLDAIKTHIEKSGQLYIGTDSMISKKECTLVTSICLHGAEGQTGGNYFWKKTKYKNKKYQSLPTRIFQEVADSVQLGLSLLEIYPDAPIELHLDVSQNKTAKTSTLVEQLTGYVRGAGFDYKIKPNSWASSSVADKHSK